MATRQQIEIAQEAQADHVLAVLSSAGQALAKLGCNVWLNYFYKGGPGEQSVKQGFNTSSVYLVYASDSLPIGTISLDSVPAGYYQQHHHDCWHDKSAQAMYLRKLAVAPEHEGRGLAKMLINKVEQEARQRGAAYIRLDVNFQINQAQNDKLVSLYSSLGYLIRHQDAAGIFMEKAL